MLIQHKISEPLLTVMWLPLYCDPGHISNHVWHTMQWGLKIAFYDVLVECQIPFGWFYFFTTAQQPLVGQGLLIMDDSWSHSDTPHSVGPLWTSHEPDAETSTWQHTTFIRDKHPCPRRDSNPHPSKRAAADPRLDRAATGINRCLHYRS